MIVYILSIIIGFSIFFHELKQEKNPKIGIKKMGSSSSRFYSGGPFSNQGGEMLELGR